MTPKPLVETVMEQAEAARSTLTTHPVVGRYVRVDVPLPAPYLGGGEIRVVVIGQDPTIQDGDALSQVRTVLKLDRRGPLLNFVSGLCQQLGLTLDNVYATNACKNHFTSPPTTIKLLDGIDVLERSADVWLPILSREVHHFPSAVVISLGQPVLSMLVSSGSSREMKWYWGYHRRWREGYSNPMKWIAAEGSTLGVRVFPFVHQPTVRGQRTEFYRTRRDEYVAFIRRSSGLELQ